MDNIKDIPYTTAEFDKDGRCIRQPVVPDEARELIVISHGWNNTREHAEHLYLTLLGHVSDLDPGNAGKFAIVGVIWPSKEFDFSNVEAAAPEVNSAATGGASQESQRAAIAHAMHQFEEVFKDSGKQDKLAALRTLSTQLDQPDKPKQFVEALRELVGTPDSVSKLDGSRPFFSRSPEAVFEDAGQASAEVGNTARGGQVDAQGIKEIFGGIANAVSSLFNITSYYEMKKRAGTVGADGLAPVIDALAARQQIRHIHLVGHSFGARLVTAAAMASATPKLYSLTLLQAAFSHNGFSQIMSGYFRQVVAGKRVAGPIVVTYTENDKAVGKAYAIASRISHDTTADLGNASDVFGGLGRNGARNMGPHEVSGTATRLLDKGESYRFDKQMIHNLEASPFIKHHGDVAGVEVAWAIRQSIATAAST